MPSQIHLPGARTDLGLDVTWRYSFLPANRTAERLADTVFIDVGGRLEPGVIDHHHVAAGSRSSARLVADHPAYVYEHLVAPWVAADRVARVHGRSWHPTLATHIAPDFDAIVTTRLVLSLVECGRFPCGYEKLVEYADQVDSGLQQPKLPAQKRELYPLILMLQNVDHARSQELAKELKLTPAPGLPDFDRHELTLRLGLHLVDLWLDGIAAAMAPQRALPDDDKLVHALADEIERDADRFCEAKARYRAIGSIRVPSSSGESVWLRGAVLVACRCDEVQCVCSTPPLAFDKIYLRAGFAHRSAVIEATPLTVIEKPRVDKSGRPPARPTAARHRWIIAIDPHVASGRTSLEGLGASLEWAEQAKRVGLDGTDARKESGETRFTEYPGVKDPWYDGRGHHWTIVDSPAEGSVLTGDEVIGTLSEPFWDPLLEDARAWKWGCDAGPAGKEPVPEGSERRLAGFLRHARREAREGYVVAVVRVRSGWRPALVAAALRDFVSGSPVPVPLADGAAYVGPDGTVVVLDHDSSAFEPCRSLTSLFSLHRALHDIEQQAHDGGDQSLSGSGAKCRALRKRFINSVATYNGLRESESPDDRTLRLAIEEALRLDRRREGTGALLQLLDDEEQEMSEWRLNRLGLILAIMGVLQTVIAAFDAIEACWGGDNAAEQYRFHVAWAAATFALTAACAVFAVTMMFPPMQRLYARFWVLGRFFPEHAAPAARHAIPHDEL